MRPTGCTSRSPGTPRASSAATPRLPSTPHEVLPYTAWSAQASMTSRTNPIAYRIAASGPTRWRPSFRKASAMACSDTTSSLEISKVCPVQRCCRTPSRDRAPQGPQRLPVPSTLAPQAQRPALLSRCLRSAGVSSFRRRRVRSGNGGTESTLSAYVRVMIFPFCAERTVAQQTTIPSSPVPCPWLPEHQFSDQRSLLLFQRHPGPQRPQTIVAP